MLLALDVGNTNTVLGFFRASELVAHWRLTTARDQTVDEYGILTRELFTTAGIDPESVSGVIISSVVPPRAPSPLRRRPAAARVSYESRFGQLIRRTCSMENDRRSGFAPGREKRVASTARRPRTAPRQIRPRGRPDVTSLLDRKPASHPVANGGAGVTPARAWFRQGPRGAPPHRR